MLTLGEETLEIGLVRDRVGPCDADDVETVLARRGGEGRLDVRLQKSRSA
jgi:hypothetical protein